MANNCFYAIKAVSKNEGEPNNLDRLIRIMLYQDPEWYIARVFSVDYDDCEFEDGKDGEKYVYQCLYGDVAWSCHEWVRGETESTTGVEGTARLTTITNLCKLLKIGVEIWSQEPGFCFEEHYIINADGKVVLEECVDWFQYWTDEAGHELDTPVESGGFYNFGDYLHSEKIYNGKKK